MAVTLRPVGPEDQSFLLRVYASTRADELAPVPWTDEQKAAFVAHQFAAQTAHYAEHYKGVTADIVLVDGVPVGRLYVARWESEIRVVDIALLPEGRGRGIGSALLQGLIEESESAGKPLTVHVERQNPALGWYERLGFRVAADKGVYLFLERAVGAQAKTAS